MTAGNYQTARNFAQNILTKEIKQMFHNFQVINTKTGSILPITQIGRTPADAEILIREYNLKGIDWTHRKLVYLPEEQNITPIKIGEGK